MSQGGGIGNGGGGGGVIQTIDGDTGSITGATVTIFSNNAINNAGASVKFVNSGTVSTLNFTDSNMNTTIGQGCGNPLGNYSLNTACGRFALHSATTSSENTGIGEVSLASLTSGSGSNTACGWQSGELLLTGSNNSFFGVASGIQYTGSESNNTVIDSPGVTGDNNVTRIGKVSGGGAKVACFMGGITGVTVPFSSPVLIDANGQLSDGGFGTATQVWTSNGAGVSPSWQPASGGGFTPVSWSVQLSANQTNVTGNNTQYQIPYDSVLFDSASGYNAGTFLYTIPTTGVYNITVNNFLFGGTAASTLFFSWLSVNAAAFPGLRITDANSATLGLAVNGEFLLSSSYVGAFTAGDTIGIFVDVIGGISNDVGAGGGSASGCLFSGFRVA